MHIVERTLDDLLRRVIRRLLAQRSRIKARRGKAAELLGVTIELQDPRARLSRTEGRGRLFSSLGELLWYLSKSNKLEFIEYYLSKYKQESADGVTVYGGYGPRLFRMHRRYDQIARTIALLRDHPTSRRAAIQVFDAADTAEQHVEIPCTCTFQFLIREGRMYMLTYMRSNDVYLGLPHDIFAFTMLQEMMAATLGVGLGTYTHMVGSLHLYDKDRESSRLYLKEGVQSHVAMPKMPSGDPWAAVETVLAAETALRRGRDISVSDLSLAPYWADIVRLLKIHQHFKKGGLSSVEVIKGQLSTHIYDAYINDQRWRRERSA